MGRNWRLLDRMWTQIESFSYLLEKHNFCAFWKWNFQIFHHICFLEGNDNQSIHKVFQGFKNAIFLVYNGLRFEVCIIFEHFWWICRFSQSQRSKYCAWFVENWSNWVQFHNLLHLHVKGLETFEQDLNSNWIIFISFTKPQFLRILEVEFSDFPPHLFSRRKWQSVKSRSFSSVQKCHFCGL